MDQHRSRAESLLKRMTIEEKIAQLCALWIVTNPDGRLTVRVLNGVRGEGQDFDAHKQLRDGIGQITRPLGTSPVALTDGVRTLNRLQRFLVRQTRLGIPALPHEECIAGLMAPGATMFPAAINLGASWNPALVETVADAIGRHVLAAGSRQGLAPVLDVCRDARWGRTEECFGEDPLLVGTMGCAYVRGLQGPDQRVLATLKHYVGHSFSEGGRNHAPVRIGPRELYDVFMVPFEMAIREANAGSLMPAYHDLDGVPVHESVYYLHHVLRERWGFEGLIVADYEGITQLLTDHRTQSSLAHAAAAALKAGVDQELPGDSVYREGLKDALERGLVEPAAIDASVRRVLIAKSRLGLFEHPFVDEEAVELNCADERSVARRAAAESMVLLKNDGILPLANETRIAVVGPLADDALAMLNGYSFPVHLIVAGTEGGRGVTNTVRAELEGRTVSTRLVTPPERWAGFAAGCRILTERPKDAPVFPGDVAVDGSTQKSYLSNDESMIPEAVALARRSECVIAMVGDLAGLFLTGTVGEGSDTASLSLPGVQEKLLDALLDSGTPVVVVLSSGRPYCLGRSDQEAAAILYAGLPGQEGAAAIADVLYGVVNPGGKLPISGPYSAGAMPFFYNHKRKSPGTPVQPQFGARYPFGFGLSYSRLEVRAVTVTPTEVAADGEFSVSCEVFNHGPYPGDEVVQVYVRDLYATLVRPVMELKSFHRVSVPVGAARSVHFNIPCDLLSYTDANGRRMVETGQFEIMVGTSSRCIVHRATLTVSGENRLLEGAWRMSAAVHVW